MSATRFAVMALCLTVLAQAASAEREGPRMRNPFFAMDTCTKAHYPASDVLSPDAQLDLLKELGYAGIAWTAGDPAQTRAVVLGCKKRGMKLFAHYVGATLRRDALEFPPTTLQELDALAGAHAVVWVHIGSPDYARSSPEGDATAVDALRRFADEAAARGLRVALYPHVGDWTERVQDCVRVAEKVGRPNLGVTFNLCHCLQVGDETRIPELLAQAAPRLFVVTINGADAGAAGASWNRLIQTLDRGTYDIGIVLRKLRELRYTGPIGLQGFGIGGDIRDNLARSMAAWRKRAD